MSKLNKILTVSENNGIPKILMTDTIASLDPNKYYVWDVVSSLQISLNTGIQDNNHKKYIFKFKSGSTPTTLLLPSEIRFIYPINIKRNHIYYIEIENNKASFSEYLYELTYPQSGTIN